MANKSDENCKLSYSEHQYCSHIPDHYKRRLYNMETNDILRQRGSRYGDLIDNGSLAQNFKAIMRLSNNWADLPEDIQEALDMTASKISRILTGDFYYDDNWQDIIGYSQLVLNRINGGVYDERNKRQEQEKAKIPTVGEWAAGFRDKSNKVLRSLIGGKRS